MNKAPFISMGLGGHAGHLVKTFYPYMTHGSHVLGKIRMDALFFKDHIFHIYGYICELTIAISAR